MAVLTSLPVETLLLVFDVVAFGGVVTGVNGFGFAVVGTSLLTTVVEPRGGRTDDSPDARGERLARARTLA